MILQIINKLIMIGFFMACLNSFRHGYYFVQTFFQSTVEEPKNYRLVSTSLVLLGVSIAFILTVIFTGFKIQ